MTATVIVTEAGKTARFELTLASIASRSDDSVTELASTADDNLLLYVGAGIATGAFLLAVIAGIVCCSRPRNRHFRYGAFIIPFSIIFGGGYYLAAIAFAFQFLSRDLGIYLAIVFGCAFVGLVVAAITLTFRSRSMLLVQSIPFVFCYPLLPVAIWNVVYAIWVAKKPTWDVPAKGTEES